MATEEPLNSERTDQVQGFIERMPALSSTVTKVLEVCNRLDTSANDLNRIISLDPVLTGRVLKLINSAYYALPEQVSSLTRAIIMLGINTVKNLALSTAVVGALKGLNTQQALSSDQFWNHSLCVGVTGKALAAKRGLPYIERDDYFVAGLLHDLGKMPLLGCFSSDYSAVVGRAKQAHVALHQAEQELFGFHHGWVGKEIAEKWKLGSGISECLNFHHAPEKASKDVHPMVATVELANIFVNKEEISAAGDPHPDTSHLTGILQALDMNWEDVVGLKETVLENLEKAQAFIKTS